MKRPCWVYRASDVGGTLLYVGSSFDVDGRLRYHEAHSPWWPFQCHITRTYYASEQEARIAETTAIATEHPRWNIKDRSPEHPDGRCTTGAINAPHLREEVDLWRAWLRNERDLRRAQDIRYRLSERMFQIAAGRALLRDEQAS